MKLKKILKIISGVLIFLTLPSLLLFGYLYFKYNEPLPNGIISKKADALAYNMLDALDYEAYKSTNLIEWTFERRHHYKWYKNDNTCEVYWKRNQVNLNFKDYSKSKVFVNGEELNDASKADKIKKAIDYFNNDSFWLVAPYKVFDKGVVRKLVKTNNKEDALLVTYSSGGSTPEDSYLWLFNDNGKPKAFKMWVSVLPIGGLEASWNNWTITESGAQLPAFHKFLVIGLNISDLKTSK